MNKTEEIFNYIRDNFNLDRVPASTLVWNIIEYLVDEVQDAEDRADFAGDLLDGLGLEEDELEALFKV